MHVDEARFTVKALEQRDPKLRSYTAGRRLTFAGSGVSTVALNAGPDYVVRVTDSEHFDCDIINTLYRRNHGANVGWVRIFYVVNLTPKVCVAVVERVRTYDDLSPRDRRRALDAMYAAANLFDYGAEPDTCGWEEKQVDWFNELAEGLSVVSQDDRDDEDPLDANANNFGITKSGRAVWIDFGI